MLQSNDCAQAMLPMLSISCRTRRGGETGCVLEVFNALGESIAVVTVPLSAVEPLAADEVFAVRRLAETRE